MVTHLATNMSVDSVADELASLPGACFYALMLSWPAQGHALKSLLGLSACKMYNRDQRSGQAPRWLDMHMLQQWSPPISKRQFL